MTHVLRREYGTFRLYSGASRGDHRMWLGLRRYAANLMAETSGLALPLMSVAFLASVAILPRGSAGSSRAVAAPGSNGQRRRKVVLTTVPGWAP